MARYPNGRNFKHKRPARPEEDTAVFELLRLMRGHRTCDIAAETWVSRSTISALRTRRTRWPRRATYAAIARALGYEYVLTRVDEVRPPKRQRVRTSDDDVTVVH